MWPIITLHEQNFTAPKKSNEISKHYLFQAENATKSEDKLFFLNKSLSFAEFKDDLVGIYAKRVSIYNDMKLSRQCLENQLWIRRINKNYEFEMKYDYEIKPACLIQFAGREHKKLPNVLSSVRLNDSGELIATKSLKAGQLIAIEDSFCGNLLEDGLYQVCRNCLGSNHLNLIPCEGCTNVMFCSSKCSIAAKFHHEYECKTLAAKVTTNFSSLPMALRSCFEILLHFDGSVKKMKKFVDRAISNPKSIFKTKSSGEEAIEKFEVMLASQQYKEDDDNDRMRRTIAKILNTYPKMHKHLEKKSHKKFLVDFVMKNCNHDVLLHTDLKKRRVGTSFHFLYSLMTHSCASNVHSIFNGGEKLYYFTKYPIKAGEILTYNHALEFELHPLHYRQEILEVSSSPSCVCDACFNDYPTFENMEKADDDFQNDVAEVLQKTINGSKEDVFETFKLNCEYIDKNYESKFLKQEIFLVHRCNIAALSRLLS
jgi:hypothetical protein